MNSSPFEPISKVLITAGTHGNELSGIELLNNIKRQPSIAEKVFANPTTLSIDTLIVNKMAVAKRTRYVEEDLNRQFSQEKLSWLAGESLEHQLAIEFNTKYGPKHESSIDLIIDIHNTTSNMGPTLIILESDAFHTQLARFVKTNMPEAIILIEDQCPMKQHAYLCTVGKRGLMIEVGPQAQGILCPDAYLQTEEMTRLILAFCETWNIQAGNVENPEVDAFRLSEEVMFPLDDENNKTAMIHPDLHWKDFQKLSNGSPAFLSFEHQEILWEGEDAVYPHFIGEAAYYHLNIAFALAKLTRI